MWEKGQEWPPDKERIANYRKYEALYEGRHAEVFKDTVDAVPDAVGDKRTKLVLDYPRSIVDIPAELLVGQPPVISYEDPILNASWQGIADRSDWDPTLLEMTQDAGKLGDAVLLARRTAQGARLEAKPAYCYFPELADGDVRAVRSEALAWQETVDGKKVVRVDRFDSVSIRREAYYLDTLKLGDRLTSAEIRPLLGKDPEVELHGLARSALVHLPNTRSSNQFFGRSDLGGGLPALFEEANYRLTQIARILDKHASPKMAGPSSFIGEDGRVDLAQDYFGIGQGQTAPQYLVWNAQLEIAIKQLEVVFEEILKHSKISKLLMGFVNGASYDSARAYKMQLTPTLGKVDRKAIYLDRACSVAVRVAVALDLGRAYSEVPPPNIRWRLGLPKDLSEMATTNNLRIQSRTLSRRSAVMAEMDCDEATAENELDLVAQDEERFGMGTATAPAPEKKQPLHVETAPASEVTA